MVILVGCQSKAAIGPHSHTHTHTHKSLDESNNTRGEFQEMNNCIRAVLSVNVAYLKLFSSPLANPPPDYILLNSGATLGLADRGLKGSTNKEELEQRNERAPSGLIY